MRIFNKGFFFGGSKNSLNEKLTSLDSVRKKVLVNNGSVNDWELPLVSLSDLALSDWQLRCGIIKDRWENMLLTDEKQMGDWSFASVGQEWLWSDNGTSFKKGVLFMNWDSGTEQSKILNLQETVLDLQPFALDKGAEGWWERQGIMSLNMEELEEARKSLKEKNN